MATDDLSFLPPAKGLYAPAVVEDVLQGYRALRRAFLEQDIRTAGRNSVLVAADQRDSPVFLIHSGFAFRSHTLSDGRRAITELLLPGDFISLDHVVLAGFHGEIGVAERLGYRMMSAASIRELMKGDPQIARLVHGLIGEARRRLEQHLIGLTRLDARERFAALLVGIYDRLRRGYDLPPTLNLPLSQEMLGDHLGLTPVHVSRTAMWLREERLAVVKRELVILRDVEGLRALARGAKRRSGMGRQALERAAEPAAKAGVNPTPLGTETPS